MAAYLIGQIKVTNPEQWQLYVDGVRETLSPFGAEVVFRGRQVAVLAGDASPELAVVIRFADREALLAWHRSPEYQALVPVRNRAAEVSIVGFEEAP